MSNKKIIASLILLLLFDFVSIYWFVKQFDTSGGSSLYLFIVVPLVVVINVITSGIAQFVFKQKTYALLFLLNALLAGIIMYVLFNKQVQNNRQTSQTDINISNNSIINK